MSSPYAGADVFPSDYLIPDDSDPPTAAAVNIGLEALGDRTKYLLERSGAPVVASLAALVAITTPSNGWVRNVEGFGTYIFDSASSATVASPYVLAPTDLTPGRWIGGLNLIHNAALGLAGLDATANIQILGTDDTTHFPQFTTQRSRFVFMLPIPYLQTQGPQTVDKTASFWNDGGAAPVRFNDGHLRLLETPSTIQTQGVLVPLNDYLHDGATLAGINFDVTGGGGHSSLGSITKMQAGIFRTAGFTGGGFTTLCGSDFTLDASASIAAYEANHTIDVFTTTLNVIDKSQFLYWAQWWGEFGTDAQEDCRLHGLRLILNHIADARFP